MLELKEQSLDYLDYCKKNDLYKNDPKSLKKYFEDKEKEKEKEERRRENMKFSLEKLKGLRVEKGFTQTTLANAIGIAPITYTKKENGLTEFTASEICHLAYKLNVDIQYFFG